MRSRDPNWGRNDQNVVSQEDLEVAKVFQENVYKTTKLMVSYIM